MASRIWGDGFQPTSDGLQPTLPVLRRPLFSPRLPCGIWHPIQYALSQMCLTFVSAQGVPLHPCFRNTNPVRRLQNQLLLHYPLMMVWTMTQQLHKVNIHKLRAQLRQAFAHPLRQWSLGPTQVQSCCSGVLFMGDGWNIRWSASVLRTFVVGSLGLLLRG